MKDFETNRKQFMYDIGKLKNTFQDYVHNTHLTKALEKLDTKFIAFAPWESVRLIDVKFDNYIKLADYMEYKEMVNTKFNAQSDEIY